MSVLMLDKEANLMDLVVRPISPIHNRRCVKHHDAAFDSPVNGVWVADATTLETYAAGSAGVFV